MLQKVRLIEWRQVILFVVGAVGFVHFSIGAMYAGELVWRWQTHRWWVLEFYWLHLLVWLLFLAALILDLTKRYRLSGVFLLVAMIGAVALFVHDTTTQRAFLQRGAEGAPFYHFWWWYGPPGPAPAV